MAHSFDELVELQRAADQAYNRVEELRDSYGAPTASIWTGEQTETWETAWRAWRELARDVQIAVKGHAQEQGQSRHEVEAALRKATRHGDEG
ncbi:hypothetical protein ACFYYI_32135 [Streptomyces sp. NPDC002387]|uniref:hypothetical protein n=1 Tax=unclassified Streptomyces TaxID=2593676 RepID=UPI0033FC79B8